MRKLKILWIKVGGLWPVDRGGRRRSFEILKELATRHEVTVLTTHDPVAAPDGSGGALAPADSISVPVHIPKHGSVEFVTALARSWLSKLPADLWRCRSPVLAREIASRLPGVDVCVADFLAATPNLPAEPPCPVVLFEHNVEHQIWHRLAGVEHRPWRRALLEIEWRKMRRYESRMVASARRTVAVSDADRALLAAEAPGADVHAIPTGVDAAYFHPNGCPEDPSSLVYVGAMDWYPNEDAVLHFVERILPLIRKEVPEARLTVVGRNPSARVQALAPDVRVTGTVDDVRPYVDSAAVVVVPLRIAGGTRLKIFEALAMARPVVSTTVGAEGLPVSSGEHLLLADEPETFARAVSELLRHPEQRQALGAAGRRLVEERYSWAAIARAFERELEEVRDAR